MKLGMKLLPIARAYMKIGSFIRVIAKIYANANYQYLIDTASINAFQRE